MLQNLKNNNICHFQYSLGTEMAQTVEIRPDEIQGTAYPILPTPWPLIRRLTHGAMALNFLSCLMLAWTLGRSIMGWLYTVSTYEKTKWPRLHDTKSYVCGRLGHLTAFIISSSLLQYRLSPEWLIHNEGVTSLYIRLCRLSPEVINMKWSHSISQEICTRFCCALLCCGYAIVHNEFTWSIYPYSSGLLCWHWGNR